MSRPILIDQIIKGLGFNKRTKVKRTPAVTYKILHRDVDGEIFDTEWENIRECLNT